MQYYKKLKIKNLDVIRSKVLDFVKANEDVLVVRNGAINFDYGKFCNTVPELLTAFASYGLKMQTANFYITNDPTTLYVPPDNPVKNFYDGKFNPIHVDFSVFKARINIPILNYENTSTKFFKNVVTELVKNPVTNTAFYKVVNNDYIEVDSLEYTEPTVINVSEPHMVYIPEGSKFPRIVLTLGMDRDPVFLIPKNK